MSRHIHRTLMVVASTCIVAVSVMASPIAADTAANNNASPQRLQRREEKDSDDKLIDGKAPEGPILLVFGGLAVAAVCLVFVVIRVNLNTPTTASGRQIMEERAKARTDLRLRGGNSQQTTRIGLDSNLQSPSATPTMSRSDTSDMLSASPLKPGQGSAPPKTKAQRAALRGYSGSSFSRASGGERSYSSFASMMDVPMLSSSGRMGTTNSQESGQSEEYSKGAVGIMNAASRPIGPRGPQPQRQSQFGRAQDKRNSTLYRGTNLTLTRSGSGRTPALRPSAVTPSYHPAPGSPKHQQGQELRRYQSDSAEQSRRSSAANLLDDDYLAPAQGPSPYASAGSSSSDHSSGLTAATQHPLSTSSHQRQPLQPGHYITSNYWKQQGQSPAYPQASGSGAVAPSPNSMYYNASSQPPSASPHQGVFSAVDGARGRDEESFAQYDNSRPGQFTQPVAEGNGRRGIRGAPAGARPMS